MRAMILAAGKGTRLGELTRDTPKPLVPLAKNKRIIDITVERLRQAGIDQIAVNLHHHGLQVKNHLESTYANVRWEFFPEDRLLNTGGGIFNARSFLEKSEHFVVTNSDIVHYIPMDEIVRCHIDSGALVTMALKPSNASRAVIHSHERGVLGFTDPQGNPYYGRPAPPPGVSYGTFVGIQVLHRSIFDEMHQEVFSVIDTYDALIAAGERVHVYDVGNLYWTDLGTPESLEAGRRVFGAADAAQGLLGEPLTAVRSVFEGAGEKQVVRFSSAGRSVIGVASPREDELEDLDRLTTFLGEWGVPVPIVLGKNPGSVLQEDGGRQLAQAISENDETDALSVQAAAILDRLAAVPTEAFADLRRAAPKVYDRDNMLFDLRYFNEYVLGAEADLAEVFPAWKVDTVRRWTEATCSQAADVVRSWFDGQPLVLMHRDFQSTNLVIDNAGSMRLVDLGTLRLGYSVYDLASLAFDIYLPHSERRLRTLTGCFFDHNPDLDQTLFWGAAWMRLLHATATAFRFAPEKPFFAATIPTCLKKLDRVMREPAAHGLLSQLPNEVTTQLLALLETLLPGQRDKVQ